MPGLKHFPVPLGGAGHWRVGSQSLGPRHWKGTLPERAQRIDAPTNMVWLIGRTQTNGASDYENVHAIQRGYRLMPLSLYPDGPRKRPVASAGMRTPGAVATPPMRVQQLTPAQFFNTFAELLVANPPHPGDEPMMRDLAKIGIEPGKPFRPEALGAGGSEMKALDNEGAKIAVGSALARTTTALEMANRDRRVGPAAREGSDDTAPITPCERR